MGASRQQPPELSCVEGENGLAAGPQVALGRGFGAGRARRTVARTPGLGGLPESGAPRPPRRGLLLCHPTPQHVVHVSSLCFSPETDTECGRCN